MQLDPLPAPEWLSPSSLERYENCPLAYRLINLERYPDPSGRAASVGTFVHLVLEHLLAGTPDTRTPEAARALAAEHFGPFADSDDFRGLDLDAAGVAAFKRDCWQMIENYFTLEDPEAVAVEGTERWVRGAVGDAPVRGIIDRLERDGGELVVVDYKTGKPPNPRYVADRFKAMHIYAALCEGEVGERPARLRLLYLAGPVDHDVAVTDATLAKAAGRVERLWAAIREDCASGSFEPCPGRLCDWCPLQAHCPAFGGDLAVAVEVAAAARAERAARRG